MSLTPTDRFRFTMPMPKRRSAGLGRGRLGRRRFASAVAACLWCAIAVATGSLRLPSPLAGPGVEQVKRSDERRIERAWRDLLDGDLKKSERRASRAGSAAPARLLRFQIRLLGGDETAIDELATLCEDEHPDYAAAWITLSVAAERAGREILAVGAARRGVGLWPGSPWRDRAVDLEQRWITDRILRAETLTASGDIDAALTELALAEALDPDSVETRMVRAEALYAGNRIADSLAVLDDLGDEPGAMLLRGIIAEERQQWQQAMEAYSALPAHHPERSTRLDRVQIRWRMTMLPTYSQEAIASTALTRGELAIALVASEPRLAALPGGPVPVMSDIVDNPGQREIIVVVRLGIMDTDQREHNFHPERAVDAAAVRRAVDRVRAVLDLPAVVWCEDPDVVGSGCQPMPSPPSGGAVVNAMLGRVSGAVP